MTQSVDLALPQLKLVMGQMAPAGQPALQGVWIYPDEYELINLDSLPIVLVSEAINIQSLVSREAQRTTLMHKWQAQVQIMLAEGTLTDDSVAAQFAGRHRGWIRELVRVTVSNSTLNGTAQGVGVKIPGELLTYRIGQIPWWNSRMFWGVNAMIEVYQMLRHSTEA
jgi:hypothetical protein